MAQQAPNPHSDAAARRALDETLLERLRRGTPAATGLKASVALDLGPEEGWTVAIDGGRMSLAAGLDTKADTTVIADPVTILEVFSGTTSGVAAFLDGRLKVRGNLAMSLRLGGLFGEQESHPRFERAREVNAAGLNTFFLEAGTGPPLVLLHGLGATNASMLPTLWDLSEDHRVIAPDLPGFGESSKPVRSYDAAFYARWLVAFLDVLGIERALLDRELDGGPRRHRRRSAFARKGRATGVVRPLTRVHQETSVRRRGARAAAGVGAAARAHPPQASRQIHQEVVRPASAPGRSLVRRRGRRVPQDLLNASRPYRRSSPRPVRYTWRSRTATPDSGTA